MAEKVELREDQLEQIAGGAYGQGNFARYCRICVGPGFKYTTFERSAQLSGYAMELHENKYHNYNHVLSFWELSDADIKEALATYNVDF